MNTAAPISPSTPCDSALPVCGKGEGDGVIVINLTRFGDLLQSQPLVHDLHRAGLRVGLVCLENFASALPLLCHVEKAWPLQGARLMADVNGNWRQAALSLLGFVHRIRQEMPGARVINLTATLPARLLARMLAVTPESISGFSMDEEGFGFSGGIWTSFLAGTVLRRLNTPFNLVDTFRMVGAHALSVSERARAFSGQTQNTSPNPLPNSLPNSLQNFGLQTPPVSDMDFARALLEEGAAASGAASHKGYVAMQLGASEARRQWPVASFAALGDRLWREVGLCPVLLGSPAETSLAAEYMQAAGCPYINAVGQTSISQLAALLTQCRLLVTNDTGTMHLAAGLKIPCLAIFLATAQPWDTGPYLSGCCCLEPAMTCHPCAYGRACPYEHACREAISGQSAGDLVLGWLVTGSWDAALKKNSQIGSEARVWLTTKDKYGFADLRCLSGHEGEDRSLWLYKQRIFWRQILDSLEGERPASHAYTDAVDDSARALADAGSAAHLCPAREAEEAPAFSLAFAESVRDCLTQSLNLLNLLEEQGGLVGRSVTAGQLFLRNCERLQNLLDANLAFTALGGFWRELRQQRGGHMDELMDLIRQLKGSLTLLKQTL
ncbi:glycosyltransferase family 9 protein [Desulfovibrio intestinalis]|uniref:ADP-heptose:LPS heptosyltransferase n=1 Tax=Desulfovibrio intestinalis TaxID=58621 RepID=A0A7W8C2D6_9BACT|nr:glycosyltransferase family 9 protein [Desulfovibrio intestinalis]MBB5144355.1 ADP-heptose:LPS heptosyltransferase [Desulfovibrio intestinalis]